MANPDPDPRKLIYVVDDEEFMSDMIREILLMENFDALSFQDPCEALEQMQSADRKPDLLLTDFVMHGLNGMELILECKRIQPGLKTILFSGNMNGDIMKRYDFRPNYFINKPFLSATLLKTVRQCFEAAS